MPIVWKVVDENRFSAMIKDRRYQLKYKKGCIVKAKPKTLGIFTFKRKKDAVHFSVYNVLRGISIIKVKAIGRGKTPKIIGGLHELDIFYKGFEGNYFVPEGTICYKSVEVLV